MLKSIYLCVIYMVSTFTSFSFPIARVTYKQLIETSTHIVVGYKKASSIHQLGDFDYIEEIVFEVYDSLTENFDEKLITISHRGPYTVCPAPPKFEDKKLMLLFLIWDDKLKEYRVNSLSYGTVNIDKTYYRSVSYVKSYLEAVSIKDPNVRNSLQIDWLITTINSPIFRNDAIFDLLSETPNEETVFSYYPRPYAKKFSKHQYLRLKSKCYNFNNKNFENSLFKEFCSIDQFPVDIEQINKPRLTHNDTHFDADFGGL